jgi:hypothetical protein
VDLPAGIGERQRKHRPAEVARPGQRKAPRHVTRLADADANARRDDHGRVATRHDSERLPVEPAAVELAGHAECLAEATRARAEKALVVEAAALAHLFETGTRLERAQQHPGAMPGGHADEVEAPVQAVGAVDIGMARRAEHRRVACRVSGEAVRGRVGLVVGLGLDDDAADTVDEDPGADQGACHLGRGSAEIQLHRSRIRERTGRSRGLGPQVRR